MQQPNESMGQALDYGRTKKAMAFDQGRSKKLVWGVRSSETTTVRKDSMIKDFNFNGNIAQDHFRCRVIEPHLFQHLNIFKLFSFFW